MRSVLLLIPILLLVLHTSDAAAASKALNFFKSAKARVQGLFGSGSYGGSCSNCEAVYGGPKPTNGSGLPVWAMHPKGQQWTAQALQSIDKSGIAHKNPKDAAVYCPNWKNLNLAQRRSFWLAFSSKLAEQESGFRSTQMFFESKGASFGSSSNGLFSMSVGDCSSLKTTSDTINDSKNIDCAIQTMNRLLGKHGYIGTGANRGLGNYWQPLNDNPKHYRAQTLANKRAMLNYTRNLPVCRSTARADWFYILSDENIVML